MKYLTTAMFSILLIMLVGAAIAVEPGAQPIEPEILPAPEQVEVVGEAVAEEETVDLELFEEGVEEAGACCFAECFTEYGDCIDSCNLDPACMNQCQTQLNSCTNGC